MHTRVGRGITKFGGAMASSRGEKNGQMAERGGTGNAKVERSAGSDPTKRSNGTHRKAQRKWQVRRARRKVVQNGRRWDKTLARLDCNYERVRLANEYFSDSKLTVKTRNNIDDGYNVQRSMTPKRVIPKRMALGQQARSGWTVTDERVRLAKVCSPDSNNLQ